MAETKSISWLAVGVVSIPLLICIYFNLVYDSRKDKLYFESPQVHWWTHKEIHSRFFIVFIHSFIIHSFIQDILNKGLQCVRHCFRGGRHCPCLPSTQDCWRKQMGTKLYKRKNYPVLWVLAGRYSKWFLEKICA